MKNLQEFRQKHPQYDDMDDMQLANALHRKFYSDIPQDEFYQKLGIAPKPQEPKSGLAGIGQDIMQGIKDTPGAIGDFLSEIPGQAYESGKQILNNPFRAAGNIGAGVLEGVKGGLNIPSNIAEYLNKKDIGRGKVLDYIRGQHIGDTGLEKAIFGENQPGDELLRGIGSFAPYAKLGGFAKGLGGSARRAGAAGLFGIAEEQNPITSSLMGAAGEGLFSGANKAARALTNKENFLPSSPLDADELRRALKVTQGTETGLGDVIQNPFLKRQFENTLPDIAGSGANEAMQRTAATIQDKGNEFLSRLLPDDEKSVNVGEMLQKSLARAEKETRAAKNARFDEVNNAAESANITTERKNLRDTAKQILDDINSDKDLAALADSETKRILNQLSRKTKKGDYSLRKTDFLRSKLGEKASDAYKAGNSDLGGKLASLRDAALEDINSSIDASPNANVRELRDKAMEFYKKEWLPFEDKDITKFTRKGADTDTLVNAFLKKSNVSDRANLLNKLLTKIPDSDRKALAHDYFSKAINEEGALNPSKLATLFKGLGENQKKTLFSKYELQLLQDFSDLVKKNPDALSIMFNPKTGQRNKTGFSQLLPGFSALGAASIAGVPMGFLGATLPALAGRGATKLLTSEKMRERLVKSMIKARENPKSKRSADAMTPFVNALMQSSQTKKEPMELYLNYSTRGK